MVFKKMLRAMGVGGPSVDTVLNDSRVYPGGVLAGEVRMVGGEADCQIDYIALSLVTRVERGDDQGIGVVEFDRAVVSGMFHLRAGEHRTVPFQLPVPWETPITEVLGNHLHGMALGLRTELAVAKAVDKGDMDPVSVVPLPSQAVVLDAMARLGFRFRSADLETGRIHGVDQRLPFYQEIEFHPPHDLARRFNQVELTFITSPSEVAVVLEADRRAGLMRSGDDAFGRFHAAHQDSERTDWMDIISRWLGDVSSRRSSHGHQGHHYDGDHGGHHGGGLGMVGGIAAGVVGGVVLGEVLGDIFD